MHLPDGLLNNQINISLITVSLAFVGVAFKKVKDLLLEKTKVLAPQLMTNIGEISNQRIINKLRFKKTAREKIQQMLIIFSLVFLVQMFDFIKINGLSGHLIGAALGALVLGPWLGMLAISAVLIIQATFLADGGIIALGANIFNMAIVGCLSSYYLFYFVKKFLGNKYLAIAISSYFSLILMALFYSFELSVSVKANFDLVKVHALVGVFEIVFTPFALKFIFNNKKI